MKRTIAIVLLTALMITLTMPGNETEAAQKKVTVGTFVRMLEKKTGKLDFNIGMKTGKTLTLEKAVVIMVKTYEHLHKEDTESFPDEETVRFILEERIADIESIPKSRREYFAKAYALGLIAGDKEKAYSPRRIFNSRAKCSKAECKKMIARLINEDSRYRLSPDLQVLRISSSDRPVMERFYPYILDNYPNGFYDSMLNFMVHQAKVFEADGSPLWSARECSAYCGVMTWDTTFSKLTYEDRIDIICDYDDEDRLKMYCAYLTPAEYDLGAAERNKRDGYEGMALTDERKRCMADAAEEYVKRVLNIDYRTIADDREWRDYMLRCGIRESVIDRYIAECVKDELIIECDMSAADISGIYYDRTPFAFTKCKGVVHTYAHFRIVSDNGKGFPYDELTIVNGEGRQCMRNGVISEDGYSYVWEPDNGWQDGFFDIGMANDKEVYTSIFDIMRYKAVYTQDFGYPCETEYYYPGQYTIDGVLKYKMKNKTKEEYLKEWGYLYNR